MSNVMDPTRVMVVTAVQSAEVRAPVIEALARNAGTRGIAAISVPSRAMIIEAHAPSVRPMEIVARALFAAAKLTSARSAKTCR